MSALLIGETVKQIKSNHLIKSDQMYQIKSNQIKPKTTPGLSQPWIKANFTTVGRCNLFLRTSRVWNNISRCTS